MRTVIQEPNNAYDIDDGVVFTEEALKGPRGREKSPLDARKMVRDAVHSDSFATPPEVKTNCVRVYYNDGPHVDIPVYRELEDWFGNTAYELASAEWKKSDPDGVNTWFKSWLNRKKDNGQKHSRELIRLAKSICKNRPSASLPSGFALTVLVDECYTSTHQRLDLDLRDLIKAVYERLRLNLCVRHPVVEEWLIDGDSDNKTRDLLDLLANAIEHLDETRPAELHSVQGSEGMEEGAPHRLLRREDRRGGEAGEGQEQGGGRSTGFGPEAVRTHRTE